MAIIHHGKNGLREKLENYYEERFQQDKEYFYKQIEEEKASYEKRVKAYRRAIPIRIVLLAAVVGLIVLLALCPEIIQSIQDAAHNLFSGWEASLGDAMLSRMSEESAGIGEILLNLLLSFLSLIASLLLWLVRVSSGVLVWVICFGVLAGLGFLLAKGLKPPRKPYLERKFNEEAARDWIRRESLPSYMRIVEVGLEGEERALELLGRLRDDCHIYTNLMIPYDGKVSETDVIVVGPQGVTIIEVKNYQDALVGDWSDEHITLEAERGNTTHENQVYNPVRQVGTHVYRLSNYLREHNVSVKVKRCVFFVNESISLWQMTDTDNVLEQCPVFDRFQLNSMLEELQGSKKGKPDNRVVQLLNELIEEQTKA